MRLFVHGIILFFVLISFQTLTKGSVGASSNQIVAPQVRKVEPPSWWAGHTVNPVRLLVRGANLRGASVRATRQGTKVGNVRVNGRGDYLFVDVAIDKNAQPGSHPLEVTTAGGKAVVPFEINAPLDAKTNFQGVTNDDVIYLIMPDRFANGDTSNDAPADAPAAANNRQNPRAWHGGDFRGIKNNLPYLKELGVTAIWLTPWYDNPNQEFNCDKPWCPNTNYHGYHAIDYYAVEDRFGTMADLRDLIETAHRSGIKVIQDQVANHVGRPHVWVKNPPLDNWFSAYSPNTFNNSVLLSPNASQAERDNLLRGWFNESLPDMNHDEPEVAKYQIQNALWWIGMTGIDGIRQDTIQYMPRPFIRDWSQAILKQYPRFWMVGEIFEEDSAQTAFFQGGKTGWDGVDTNLPAVFDFKLWRTSLEVFTGKKPMRALRDVLKYDGLYPNINNVVTISGNHDTDRFLSIENATTEGAMLHLAFLLSTRGIPQIYYGEEIGMRGGHDPDNRRNFPGGWQGDPRNAFTKEGRTPEEQMLFDWTQKWSQLRRGNQHIKSGKTTDLLYDTDVYIFGRYNQVTKPEESTIPKQDMVLVAFNKGSSEKQVTFKVNWLEGRNYNITDLLKGNVKNSISNNDNAVTLVLPAQSASIFDLKRRF